MKKYQWLFRILLYVSLLFLIYYLVKFDYLSLAKIQIRWFWLIISAIFLWAGFFFSTISWKMALKFHGVKISTELAVVSHGLSIFAKYIPGKLWVILGRAAYVGSREQLKVSELSFISLKEQLLYILLGLIISFFPALIYFNHDYWVYIILLTIFGLSLLLFVKPLHDFGEKILKKILRKDISLPVITFKLSIKLSFYIVIYWIFYSIGFYFLVVSLTSDANIIHAFAFPLAVSYGVLAIVTPGGIGVREGLIVAFLVSTGIDLQASVTISVISRLWFISGEVFLFFLAFLLSKKRAW